MRIPDPEVQERTKQLLKEIDKDGLSQEIIDNRIKYLEDQQKRFDEGVDLAEKLTNLVNVMSNDDGMRGFIAGMSRSHRTLQQSSFALFLQWTYWIAKKYTDNDIDLRNQYMVQAAKEIVNALGPYGKSLPLI